MVICMTKKRFQIYGDMVEDTLGIIPVTVWPIKKQQQKYCDEMNKLHEENVVLKRKLEDFSFLVHEHPLEEFYKDSLYIKDAHTEIKLKDREIIIKVYVPPLDDFFIFKYTVTGKLRS